MDLGDLEALAMSLYIEVGEDPAEPPPATTLARAWLGVRVERVPNQILAGTTYKVDGRDRISVRSSVAIEYAHFFVAHELGHLLLRRARVPVDEEEEARANYIAAALLMPRPAVLATYRAEGFAPRALAEMVTCTQTAAALRLAEAMRVPLAAVSPSAVRVRGPDDFVWPDERTLRRWADRPRPGLSRVRLTDQPRRVALVAGDD
jgi:hypothetical protein